MDPCCFFNPLHSSNSLNNTTNLLGVVNVKVTELNIIDLL